MTVRPNGIRARLAELQLALMQLTRIPVGVISTSIPAPSAACWAYPIAGLIVGALAAVVLFGAVETGLPASIAAGLCLAAGILATGALHEDGLADTADGFGGGRTRDRKLEIMRDSRIGTFGALALMLVLGLRWSAMAALVAIDPFTAALAVVAIAAASRATLAVALAGLPPARTDGLGHAAAHPSVIRVVVAVAIGLAGLVGLLDPRAAIAIATAQAMTGVFCGWLAKRHIGGQSGDVLGFVQQMVDLAGWLVLVGFAAAVARA